MEIEKLLIIREGTTGLYSLHRFISMRNPRTGVTETKPEEVVKTMNAQMMADYIGEQHPNQKVQWIIRS